MTKALRMMERASGSWTACSLSSTRARPRRRSTKLEKAVRRKPVLYLLHKCDLADEAKTDALFRRLAKSAPALKCTATAQGAAAGSRPNLPELLKEKFARDAARGMTRPPRLMVAGIPNTARAPSINAMSGASARSRAIRRGSRAANSGSAARGLSFWTPRAPCRLL